MEPRRWQLIDDIFGSALELPHAERGAFLDEACRGDEILRREVESLLEHDRSGAFIDRPCFEDAARLLAGVPGESFTGTTLGPYKILEELGAGGMGVVYRALDTKLGRTVALKLLPPDYTRDADRLRRFEREAKHASSLNHPNILTIFEIGSEGGTYFIVTELIEGETLRQLLTRGPLPVVEALGVAAQVADALDVAHEALIVHRDIKPENIMIRRRDAYVKVLDFGLAKLMEESPAGAAAGGAEAAAKQERTEAGVMLGTPSYMSPEQARALAVDARTDIWSLGVTLYEMVAGRRPFGGGTASDVMASILQKDPPPLSHPSGEPPAELGRIVTKALAKDRDERYSTTKEFLADLNRLKRRLDFEAEAERPAAPASGSTVTPARGADAVSHGATREGGTSTAGAQRATSSAEYIVEEIKRHKRGAQVALAGLSAAAAVLVAYFAFGGYFAGGGGAGGDRAGVHSAADIHSIAVLPFANTTGDPNTDYLSDGISESLINSLSQLGGVKVIARSSSFRYKGKDADPREVAKALGVRAILIGRVLRRGEELHISAELVDTRDGTQMWGEQYNRRAEDLLGVQSEIAGMIADKLHLRLTAGEQRRLVKRETVRPQTYELLLKGRFYANSGGTENWKRAVEYFNQAIAVDPTYALAHAELSRTYVNLVGGSSLDPVVGMPRAEAAALRALELDESLPDAHLALANIKMNAWDWAAAERGYRRAIELSPNYAKAHSAYSSYLSLMGRREQAIAEIKHARELDPLSVIASAYLGFTLLYARQYDEAIEALKETMELDRDFPIAHYVLGQAYVAKGMYAESVAAYREAARLGENSPSLQIYLGHAYAKAGERKKAQAILKRLEGGGEYVSPGELAILYAALGERERAFASLERAYAAHDLQLQYLGTDPAFDNLRSDPRFADLLRRIGLP
jgi:serine/threonine protein kinase/TolB-like protein/tetratricopeptide (TPR) repeat protein